MIGKPDLLAHLRFEWDAFSSLSSDRDLGMGLGPIPWSSIDRFAIRHRIIGCDFDRLVSLVQAMDGAYLDYHKAKK